MTVQIPDLWSDEVRVDVLSPLAILRTQASKLPERTQGILCAEVSGNPDEGAGYESHSLYLVAPALENYRHLVVRIRHRTELVYPVAVFAECFSASGSAYKEVQRWATVGTTLGANRGALAESDQQFMNYLRTVLRSPEVTTVILSLIARSNDRSNGDNRPPEGSQGPSQGA